MVSVKKVYRDELLQVALLLTLLRVHPNTYIEDVPTLLVGVATEGASPDTGPTGHGFRPRFHIHPKAVQRDIFEDLNALGRYNSMELAHNITAYLLNVGGDGEAAAAAGTLPLPLQSPDDDDAVDPQAAAAADSELHQTTLSQEDVDLIEVLWKQDVDLGFTIPTHEETTENGKLSKEDQEKIDTLDSLQWSSPTSTTSLKKEPDSEDDADPWSGLDYTVDLETGEYVLKDVLDIKEEIARDLGIQDELTEAREQLERIDQHLADADADADADRSPDNGPNDLPCLSLEEALQLVGLEDNLQGVRKREVEEDEGNVSDEGSVSGGMMHTATAPAPPQFHPPHPPGPPHHYHHHHHHHHPRPFQGRMPYVRAMSMEQRWQDLANLLSLPGQEGVHHAFAHHPHPAYPPHGYHDNRGVLLHNATLAPPHGDPYPPSALGSSNLGSAVATSMNLTNSSEPISDSGSVFKMENPHDLMYYQNSTPEINQTTEGLLSSILNDEDLQLMDMAMTEGMYPMRLLEGGSGAGSNTTTIPTTTPGAGVGGTEERLDASSDSAVSSMGSERVPSLSDGEWMETGSDSGHNTNDHYSHLDYHPSKFRPFDYSYTGRSLLNSAGTSASGDSHIPPVAQKKHHMFGKRYFQEQGSSSGSAGVHHRGVGPAAPTAVKFEYGGEGPTGAEAVVPPGFVSPMTPMDASCTKLSDVKYSCSLDFSRHVSGRGALEQIQHNHSYPLAGDSLALVRQSHREKMRQRKAEEEHLSRDEKRASAMNVPMTVDDIVNLPMDEFNERLSKYDLSEAQLSLIRDIRRRGKNKVAAQNCRKRKLDQIVSLADEVKEMRDRKHRLLRERDFMLAERLRVKEKFSQLYRHVFQALRDAEGNQYSPYEYSLQQSADGTVVLVPRASTNLLDDTRTKHKDPEPKE